MGVEIGSPVGQLAAGWAMCAGHAGENGQPYVVRGEEAMQSPALRRKFRGCEVQPGDASGNDARRPAGGVR